MMPRLWCERFDHLEVVHECPPTGVARVVLEHDLKVSDREIRKHNKRGWSERGMKTKELNLYTLIKPFMSEIISKHVIK